MLIATIFTLSNIIKFFIWAGAIVIIILIIALVGLNSLGRDAKKFEEDYWS